MAEVRWTDEQQQVIQARGCNVLVSAAAGSGKTAVLVERILSRITDEKDPVDVDRLLVVTFTRAAAGEMRDRISRAISERLAEDPENEHLQRQSILLHNARISTIHGFCTWVIGNYFHRTDLDPGYRIGSEGEMQLLKGDVLEKVLERFYEEKDPAFLAFSDSYAPGRSDRNLENLILKIDSFAQASPDPEGWLDMCLDACDTGPDAGSAPEELEKKPWVKEIVAEAQRILPGMRELARRNISLAQEERGPYFYLPVLQSDLELVEALCGCRSFAAFCRAGRELAFAKLSGRKKKDDDIDPELQDQVKEGRTLLKDQIRELLDQFFSESPEGVIRQLEVIRPHLQVLCGLVRAFGREYAAAKKMRSVIDFSDLEHTALHILLEKTPDGWKRTDAAKELSRGFAEVMTDEYQDSNLLQEILLEAVSGSEDGIHNRFMVGDMKQSIYGFRMARPDLFMEKYRLYTDEPSGSRKIHLRKNFRSRAGVLHTVNALFSRLMMPDLGEIAYDSDAALYPGASYPGEDPETELILLDKSAPGFEEDRTRRTMIESEALLIAQRIRVLMQSEKVFDRENGGLRDIRFRDIVILLRATAGWAETLVRILSAEGIPAYAASRTGYFSTLEVGTVLNYLRILDNPRQEIPWTSVLRSPFCGCTDRELAELKTMYPDLPLYDAALRCLDEAEPGEQPEEGLRKKLERFLASYRAFRRILPWTPVSELIRKVLEETGYGAFAASMPAGAQRAANLKMLVEKAEEYEAGSYHGLFQFIRYIEHLERYQIDYGEVNVSGEGEDCVRVMTIHKSKGLEFPVVFLAGLGGGFNRQDSRASVVQHTTLGIGLDEIDAGLHTRRSTVLKKVLQNVLKRDSLGEELRVLYVAMTRARERLIMTGAVSDAGKIFPSDRENAVPYHERVRAGCFLDWILAALGPDDGIRVRIAGPEELSAEDLVQNISKEQVLMRLAAVAGSGIVQDEQLHAFLLDCGRWQYPYLAAAELPAKLSVSEIKRQSMQSDPQEDGKQLFEEEPVVPLIPGFIRKGGAEDRKEADAGAYLGTLFHKIAASADWRRGSDPGEIRRQIGEMAEHGIISSEEAKAADADALRTLMEHPLGIRMRAAAEAGTLRREQPFVLNIPARKIDKSYDSDETILVQGVIDAYFEEDGSYVIVDYKTDRHPGRNGSILLKHYTRQLQCYRQALEQITGHPVKEMYLYSTVLGEAVPVTCEIQS